MTNEQILGLVELGKNTSFKDLAELFQELDCTKEAIVQGEKHASPRLNRIDTLEQPASVEAAPTRQTF